MKSYRDSANSYNNFVSDIVFVLTRLISEHRKPWQCVPASSIPRYRNPTIFHPSYFVKNDINNRSTMLGGSGFLNGEVFIGKSFP